VFGGWARLVLLRSSLPQTSYWVKREVKKNRGREKREEWKGRGTGDSRSFI